MLLCPTVVSEFHLQLVRSWRMNSKNGKEKGERKKNRERKESDGEEKIGAILLHFLRAR